MARGSDSLFLRGGAESLRAWSPTDDQLLRQQERQRARLTVARNATDTDDCRGLLSMLGLMPDQDTHPEHDTTASE